MLTGPLAHLRVVDVTDLRGALAARLLADMGADVIKIEPSIGSADRLRPPFAGNVAHADRSLPFLFRNANKRGAVIDLDTADGWRRFVGLCDRADILVENFSPADRVRFRLTPADVQARHAHLVHVVIADFGLTGPRAHWRAEPLVAFAAAGALHASGFPDRPPCWLPGYAAHDCAAIFGVMGALTAVLDRARHGSGQSVEVSVQEAGLLGLNPWAIPLADYGRLYPMLPASPPRTADGSYLVLSTADGHVRLLAGTLRQWRAFLTLIGNPAALSGPEWEAPMLRLAAPDVIRQIASEALQPRRRSEVVAAAARLGVPLVPVNTPDEFVAAEQTRVRQYFERTQFPHLDDAPFAPAPLRFSVTPTVLRRPAPASGEDDHGEFPPRVTEAVDGDSARPVLAGVRVVDLGVGAAIPEVGWYLAELGAEVIKIESRANLDFLRAVTLEPDTPNKAWTFNDESRGHLSVCLDLRTPRGRELALRLCATADVITENNRGGVVQSWGLDYEHVRRERPDVIYVASQGFGRGGPLGAAPSFGPLNSSFAGSNWLWNHPDAPYPAGAALNHPDHVASRLASAAVLAALEHRRRTGEGQFIEMAQTETAAYLIGEVYLETPCTGRAPQQRGNAVEYAVPHGVYPCAARDNGDDRWCAIAVMGDDAWERFTHCLGWSAAPQLATVSARLAARAEIDARVAEWTQRLSPEDAAAQLQDAGISAMPVLSPDDLRADAHLAARGAIVTVEHPEIGPERHAANPLRLSRTEFITAGAAPLLGADTEAVLTGWLGLSRAEVARLVDEGVCR
ncbi:MAG TPA: CoA transferase [Candidatus Kryptonia bacterium]|nr:CoA transferase [Candidatus Kryptonia bacterium]